MLITLHNWSQTTFPSSSLGFLPTVQSNQIGAPWTHPTPAGLRVSVFVYSMTLSGMSFPPGQSQPRIQPTLQTRSDATSSLDTGRPRQSLRARFSVSPPSTLGQTLFSIPIVLIRRPMLERMSDSLKMYSPARGRAGRKLRLHVLLKPVGSTTASSLGASAHSSQRTQADILCLKSWQAVLRGQGLASISEFGS